MSAENYFLTVLTPIADNAESRLRNLRQLERILERLRKCKASPFELCETVHMARFVIIDELPLQLGDTRREFLSRNYLLFIAELSGDRDWFLDELYERNDELVRAIWGRCAGFPRALTEARDGEQAAPRARFRSVHFRRYMRRHEIKTLIPFAGVPDLGPRDIKRAIQLRGALTKFIAEHPPRKTKDQQLYDAWRKRNWSG